MTEKEAGVRRLVVGNVLHTHSRRKHPICRASDGSVKF